MQGDIQVIDALFEQQHQRGGRQKAHSKTFSLICTFFTYTLVLPLG